MITPQQILKSNEINWDTDDLENYIDNALKDLMGNNDYRRSIVIADDGKPHFLQRRRYLVNKYAAAGWRVDRISGNGDVFTFRMIG